MHLWIRRQQEGYPMHEVQCWRVSKRRRLPLLPRLFSPCPERKTVYATTRRKGPSWVHLTRIRLWYSVSPSIIWGRHRHQFTYEQPRCYFRYNSTTFIHTSHHTVTSLHRKLHHQTPIQLQFTKINSIQILLNPFLQNLSVCFLTFLLDTQLHFPVPRKLQILIFYFSPFDIEFNASCDILNDDLFENLLKLAHSGLVGAVWAAPPCRFYSTLRKNDGGPPPLRSKEFLDGFPTLSDYQKRQVQESKEIHRRSDLICIAVFQQGGFAGKEQPLNSIAWKEPSSQQFVEQCSCYFVATPACKWGLDFFKYWAVAATSDRISKLAGHCSHRDHMDFRGKRLPDGSYISALTAEYPSAFASAIIDIISPWVSTSSLMNQDLSSWTKFAF